MDGLRYTKSIIIKSTIVFVFVITVTIFVAILLNILYNASPAIHKDYILIDITTYDDRYQAYYDIKSQLLEIVDITALSEANFRRFTFLKEYDNAKNNILRLPIDLSHINQAQLIDIKERFEVIDTFNTDIINNISTTEYTTAGLKIALRGTIIVIAIMVCISVPIGLGSAIFINEFNSSLRIRRLFCTCTSSMSAVPSIVFGLTAMYIFIDIGGLTRGSAIVGGIVLAIMSIPQIANIAYHSLNSVPISIRRAAYSLGANKSQVAIHHVLPFAISRIFTGIMVTLIRSIGETAPLLVIGMVVNLSKNTDTILSQAITVPTQLYLWSRYSEQGFINLTYYGILIVVVSVLVLNFMCAFVHYKKWL